MYPNVNTSPAYTERCMLIDMYEGVTEMDDRYFCALFELDLHSKNGSPDDYADRSVWGKANPLFVEFPAIMEKMENDFINAQKDSEKLSLFLTKNLNIWLTQDALTSYIDFNEWKKGRREHIDFTNKEVMIGIDMSKTTDLTGVTIVAMEDENILVKSKAFLPKDIINQKEVTDKIPYGAYAKNNPEWIKATDGKFVNQVEIEFYVRAIEEMYNCRVKAVAFDSWNALHLMSSLSDDYEVVDVKMSYKNFSPVVKKFREKVYEGKVLYEHNPILDFCVSNAITKSDLQENILLDKKKSQNRIDLLVSTIIGYSEFFNEELEEGAGYFIV